MIIEGDCLEVMKTFEDNQFDLAIVDPPYGISVNSKRRLHAYRNPEKSKGKIGGDNFGVATEYGDTRWDNTPLSAEQWSEIRRVSKHQIVFGLNHLYEVLGKPNSVLVWDKKLKNGWDDTFSDCELIWCSFVQPDKVYRQLWMGAIRQGEKGKRVHPTQKPVNLLKWLVSRYSQEGATVLDPFLGSGTTALACQQLNRDCTGIEINPEYVEIANKRLTQEVLL